MIRHGNASYLPDLKALWRMCFPEDDDAFVAFYFDRVYRDDETLVCLENDRPVAALQVIPYTLQVGDRIRQGGYLSGIMTHPLCRKRGYMDRLLRASFAEMEGKGLDYAFLIPQEEWLADVYAGYGFRRCEPCPVPPVNRVLKTPEQWAVVRQNFFDENGVWLEREPEFPAERKGMVKRVNPLAEEMTTLYIGMVLD
jgi:GNAT superfamily N-acetyltransferase